MRADGQVRIPPAIAKKYRLQEGDMLTLRDLGRGFIVIVPRKTGQGEKIDANKLTQDILWDRMEEEADNDVRAGRVSKPFETVEDLLRDLKAV